MLALTWAGSVGTSPVRGGLFALLASCAAGYWQFCPSPSGAVNCGRAATWPGSGASNGSCSGACPVVSAASVDDPEVGESELPVVRTMVATTAPITTTAATAEPTIVYVRRLRSFSARRSSWRSSLRLAVARRCSFVGTPGPSLQSIRSAPSVPVHGE